MLKLRYEVTFTEGILGTASANPELVREFIASKRPEGVDEAEVEAIPVAEELQKATTVFPRNAAGVPILWDYQIKGFFKDAAGMLERIDKKLKAYKKVIDGLIFVEPRQIEIEVSGPITFCERPLRADTAQGPRVALARSEEIPAGSKIVFTVKILDPKLENHIEAWMNYGADRGMGQWRNSGKGRFTYRVLATE